MTLTLGTPSTATTLDADFLCYDYQMVSLTTDKCVYVYQDTFTTGDVFARVVNVSGGSISSIGAAETIVTGLATGMWHVCQVSDTQLAIAYRDESTFGALRAVAASISGSTISAGSDVAVEATGGTVSAKDDWYIGKVADGKVVVVYQDQNDGLDGKARAANVTGSSMGAFGAAHTFASSILQLGVDWFYGNGQYCCVAYLDAGLPSGNQVFAQVLSVSGTTVTSGAQSQISTAVENRAYVRVIGMDDTHTIVSWVQTSGATAGIKAVGVSRSGTSIASSGTVLSIETGGADIVGGCVRLSDTIAIMNWNNAADEEAVELTLSGVTVTQGTQLELAGLTGLDSIGIAFVGTNKTVVIYDTDQIAVMTTDLISTASVFLLAGMPKPCDIDRDGTYIYVAMLDNSNPILIKIAAALDADGSIVFNPGSGSNIGVQCSTIDANTLWIAGEFDGTNTVEKSTDAAASFSVIDDGAISAVQGFIVGPTNENDIIVCDDAEDVFHTIDGGSVWTNVSTANGIMISMDRLLSNIDESIAGTDSTDSDTLYSPDNLGSVGIVLDKALMDVKGVIIG